MMMGAQLARACDVHERRSTDRSGRLGIETGMGIGIVGLGGIGRICGAACRACSVLYDVGFHAED